MSTSILGTAQIPRKHWEDARLINRVPFIASMFDPRISYCMYVPSAHYKSDATPRDKLPLVVNIHGSLRRAETCRDSLVELADKTGFAVLAPLFPVGLDDPNELHAYKRMSYRGTRYDKILLAIVEEVALRWPGIETAKFFLMGYSGGGQFAMRFFYLHPSKLEAVSIGAPGLVTSLDADLPWPLGIGNIHEHFDETVMSVSALSNVGAVQLAIGAEDDKRVGGGLVQWMRQASKPSSLYNGNEGDVAALDRALQSRKNALLSLNDELRAYGVQTEVVVVDGAAHETMKVVPKMIDFMVRRVWVWRSERDK